MHVKRALSSSNAWLLKRDSQKELVTLSSRFEALAIYSLSSFKNDYLDACPMWFSYAGSQFVNMMRYASVRLFSAVAVPKKRLVAFAVNAAIGGFAGYQLYAILTGLPKSVARTAEES